ncbi:MAG: valine--pyruvate transaminase [Gammaproteobacteria bacterium]|nr:valine--pyruvate transaminase [Gammaproteobacteria bacterium]MCP4089423.1 valine--pyruvate transaminase [Gammaproteobacteria bacterium]MCP4277538.1 valine--pyruvate transaminase [Gammaproteobacteria bacterium]MCP4831146.1 valine--pyruvate transaminase [Gammaproteobacteria bacterium]MCP4928569.1 valine--pyruvate transaminase [Gammaproteobacteria bacterium]
MAKWSKFGERFTRPTGARQLMDDLGDALSGDHPVCMLGGGNPAHIPELEELFSNELRRVLDSESDYRRMLANYPSPAGEERFRTSLAELFAREYGWQVTAKNIALTSGSQAGFFQLFNLLAGPQADGSFKRILLPVTPEYIGYQDVGIRAGMLTALKPTIEEFDDRTFKYGLDVDNLTVGDDIGALCVSRPTNPTGNVLSDAEIDSLIAVASAQGVPLIIDNAYGMPFPNIVFTEVKPVWNDNVIMCMSMSKLGLPGLRTGVVVASEEIIDALASMNSVLSLAVPSVGAVLLHELVESGRILEISKNIIQPYYQQRVNAALEWVHESLSGTDYRVHRPEGALFLWLWFPEIPISSNELYHRLKARDVLVLSGHHFFPGLDEEWQHRDECIRVTYSQDSESVRKGIAIIAEEVKRAFSEA